MANAFCGNCGANVLTEGICSKCNGGAFRARLHRALQSMKEGPDHSIAEYFANLRPAARRKFMLDNHDKSGANLKMAIKQRVTVWRRTQTIEQAMGKGHMIAESDLREKYGNKPDQLASILQNAFAFECPIRGCKLYADPEFCTMWNAIQEDNPDLALDLETDKTVRPTKKVKTEKAPPIQGEERELNSVELSKLIKLFKICEVDVNKCVASHEIANNHVYTDYIGAKVISKMNEKKTELLEKKSEMLSQILDSGNSRYSSKDLRKMICELRKQANNENADVESRLVTARCDIEVTGQH